MSQLGLPSGLCDLCASCYTHRVSWRERERWFYWGAPLALGPALAFLPALVYLVIEPQVKHGPVIAAGILPFAGVAEFLGVRWLVMGAVARPFNLLSMLSSGSLMILLVIAAYTGLFLAAFAGRF
jgi:hypothetical protein